MSPSRARLRPPAATRYTDLHPRTARGLARHATLSVVSRWGRRTGALDPPLQRPRIHFLCLHYLFPGEEQALRRLIEFLLEAHTFVSYSEGVERATNGPIDRPYVCLSFDDGFASAATAGRVLAEYRVSSCFFLIASMVGERDPTRVARFCRERLNKPPLEFLGWEGVYDLVAQGHEVGSHTLGHANLRDLARAELAEELGTARATLEPRVGRVRHLAWPYGRFSDFSRDALVEARHAGYASCASAERGAHAVVAAEERPLCVRRDQVEVAWPLSHNQYFIARSSRMAGIREGRWPSSLSGTPSVYSTG